MTFERDHPFTCFNRKGEGRKKKKGKGKKFKVSSWKRSFMSHCALITISRFTNFRDGTKTHVRRIGGPRRIRFRPASPENRWTIFRWFEKKGWEAERGEARGRSSENKDARGLVCSRLPYSRDHPEPPSSQTLRREHRKTRGEKMEAREWSLVRGDLFRKRRVIERLKGRSVERRARKSGSIKRRERDQCCTKALSAGTMRSRPAQYRIDARIFVTATSQTHMWEENLGGDRRWGEMEWEGRARTPRWTDYSHSPREPSSTMRRREAREDKISRT